MKDTKKIEDLIKQSKREKLDIDFTKDHHYDDVTRILEEERILDFTDMTNDSIRTINLNEDMSEFDYLT
ncbi:MAG: hypothetical protein ACRC5R_05815, partial [Mycoplasmatales bacterium]